MKFFDSICVEIVEKVEKAREDGRKKAINQLPLIVKQIKKYFFYDANKIEIKIFYNSIQIICYLDITTCEKKYKFYSWIQEFSMIREERRAFKKGYIEQLEKELPELEVKQENGEPSTIVLHRSQITENLNLNLDYSGR